MKLRKTKADSTAGFETVQQEWMLELPLKMQSTLMCNIRGADHSWAPNVKVIGRWMRHHMLKNGNGENDHSDFMKMKPLPEFNGDLEREVEYLPVHYFHHIVLGLEIMAYKHPEEDVREIAMYYYEGLVGMLHMNPETEPEMNWRLEDNPGELRDPPPDIPQAWHDFNGKLAEALKPPTLPTVKSFRSSGY